MTIGVGVLAVLTIAGSLMGEPADDAPTEAVLPVTVTVTVTDGEATPPPAEEPFDPAYVVAVGMGTAWAELTGAQQVEVAEHWSAMRRSPIGPAALRRSANQLEPPADGESMLVFLNRAAEPIRDRVVARAEAQRQERIQRRERIQARARAQAQARQAQARARAAAAAEARRRAAQEAARQRPACDPNYEGACVPPYPPDVNCSDIRTMVRVVGSDPHGLDRDRDGWGCESYG